VDTAKFPAAAKPEATKGTEFLELLRQERDLDWTFVSPSAVFGPGERTGSFRLGTDQLLVNEKGLFLDPHEGRRNVSLALVGFRGDEKPLA